MPKNALRTTALLLSLVVFVPLSALAQTHQPAYVADNIDGTVDVIDTKTDAVVATISGFTHPSDMAVSPNGKLLYVRNSNFTISVVDTETNAITGSISFPAGAASEGAETTIVFSRNCDRAYFANSLGNLVVIDTATSSVVTTLTLPSGFLPTAVAVSGDDRTLYVGSGNAEGILVVDANALTVGATIAPGHLIFNLKVSPDGAKLYASDSSSLLGAPNTNGVLVMDTRTNTVETTVPLPGSPSFIFSLAVSPNGQRLYVEDFFFAPTTSSTVTVIDTYDNSIVSTITATGLTLTGLAIPHDGDKILALNSVLSTTADSSVVVIDPWSNTIVNTIPVGHYADGLAVQPSVLGWLPLLPF